MRLRQRRGDSMETGPDASTRVAVSSAEDEDVLCHITQPSYGYVRAVARDFADAVMAVREALSAEGFGVLTEIDVQATLKKKLGLDVDPYLILGACNPPFAHKALEAEPDLGLLLPCNVTVCRRDGKTLVGMMLPTVALGVVGNPALDAIAAEVEAKMKSAVDGV